MTLPAASPASPAISCPVCGASMKERNGAKGAFLGCAKYPRCKGTREINGEKGSEGPRLSVPTVGVAEAKANLRLHIEGSDTRPGLDADQRAFLAAGLGTASVQGVAGAGSGKTHSVVALVGALVDNGQPPESIVVTTFTRKAGDELLTRIAKVVPAAALGQIRIGTFHGALAFRTMRREQPARWPLQRCLDLPDRAEGLLSAKTTWRRVLGFGQVPGTAIDGMNIGDEAGQMAAGFAQYAEILRADDCPPPRNGVRLPAAVVARIRADMGDDWQDFLNAWASYEDVKAAWEAWDFADLLEAYLAGLRNGSILDRAAVCVVDEAQDNNRVQIEIAKQITRENGRIVFVGDGRQTIYTWRGAYPEAFQHADTEIGARRVDLGWNYRSGSAIVDLGNRIADGHPWAMGAVSKAARKETGTIRLLDCDDNEAAAVASFIRAAVDEGSTPEEWAILARTNAIVGAMEAACVRERIPCAVVGGTPFFVREEVQDFLAYAILSAVPNARESVKRIRNTPKRFLGAAFDREFEARGGDDVVAVIRSVAGGLRGGSKDGARVLSADIERIRALPWNKDAANAARQNAGLSPVENPATVIAEISRLLAPPKRPARGGADSGEDDREGILSTIAAIAETFADVRELGKFARTCQGEVARVGEDDAIPGGRLTLSTVHRAKGREWKNVVVSAADGVFPHAKSTKPAQVAEELRLFYVAATRAKDALYFSAPDCDDKGRDVGFSHFVEDYVIETAEGDEDLDPDPDPEDTPDGTNGKRGTGKAAPEAPTTGGNGSASVDASTGRVEARNEGDADPVTSTEAARALAADRTAAEPHADPAGGEGSRYVPVLASSFDELLAPLGFREARRGDQRTWIREVRFPRGILSTIVYSTIFADGVDAKARPVAEDSIRIAATWTEAVPAGSASRALLAKQPWVARTRGWRLALLDRLDTVATEIRESETCPKCGAPTVRRTVKNGEFYGCARFLECKNGR